MPETAVIAAPRRTRDGRTAFIEVGAGEPVVLVHGVGMDRSFWEPQVADLARTHRVIALDMLGHGESARPVPGADLEDYAGQVIALLDELGIERANLVGHSMGALVVLDAALRHPARVLRVAALNAVFERTPEQSEAVRSRAEALLRGTEDERRAWAGQAISRWFGDEPGPETAALAERVRATLGGVDPAGYAHAYGVFARSDRRYGDALRGLAMPALFLTGELDPNSTPEMSAAMARLAPRGRLEVAAEGRHMVSLVSPGPVNAAIRSLLDEPVDDDARRSHMTERQIDPMEFRKALGSFVTGVTIVTTTQPDGTPRGFTANSFTSVSLDPPLVLVCIAYGASSYQVFSAGRPFAVNILAESQRETSGRFASRTPDKFAGVAWHPGVSGAPVLEGSAAWFECELHEEVAAGDHAILIGRVVAFDHAPVSPLVYARGNYHLLAQDQSALLEERRSIQVGAILVQDGRILFRKDAATGALGLPSGHGLGSAEDAGSLRGVLHRLGLEPDLGFVFAVYEGEGKDDLCVYYRGDVGPTAPNPELAMLVPFSEIPWASLPDEAVRSMLRRFVAEQTIDQFGVYVGDHVAGTVRTLA